MDADSISIAPDTRNSSHPSTFPINTSEKESPINQSNADEPHDVESQEHELAITNASGARKMEAIQAVWGRNGKKLIFICLAISMIICEFDTSTIYTYYMYAYSKFRHISALGALLTAGTLCFAVLKPLIAKLSDITGRGELYPAFLVFYIISYVICVKSTNYAMFITGCVFHLLASTGIYTLTDILVADISTGRQRGLAMQIQFLPHIFMPFTSAFVTQKVIHGIGWRWGIGILAILIPFGLLPIMCILLKYQRRAKKNGIVRKQPMTISKFFSQLNLMGMVLFGGGLGLVLIPASIAGSQDGGWKTPCIIGLIVIGAIMLILCPIHEIYIATNPILPFYYFKNRTIVLALLLCSMDGIALGVTHAYFYPWAVVAHNYSIRDASFLGDANRAMQFFMGLVMGAFMFWKCRYKWLVFTGVMLRLVGYGLMFRIRQLESTTAEIAIVQLIQGAGSGIITTGCFVATTMSVPRREVAQMAALYLCLATLGSSIGTAISGSIYTNQFRKELEGTLGTEGTRKLINSAIDSITSCLPAWGTEQRNAISQAYSTVMSYFTYAAFGSVIPTIFFAWFLPNEILTDTHTFIED